MSYKIVFTERYTRIAARFLQRHPDMARAYVKTLALLEVNPQHPSLRLHALGGRLVGVHSVSINLSYRITIHLLITEREIVPLDLGDHDAVY
ncbi:MAG: plasmid stabilization protein [Betaproteobacteria bacterium]|nr:plasmid stabilization protein [Betaproteobacteria bacterium]